MLSLSHPGAVGPGDDGAVRVLPAVGHGGQGGEGAGGHVEDGGGVVGEDAAADDDAAGVQRGGAVPGELKKVK